jgi:hypothetical protein
MSEQSPPAPVDTAPHPPQSQPPQSQPPQHRAPGSGLAVAAFVAGLVAALGFWVPVVNVVAILLGIAGIVLGILAVKGATRGTQGGKGLAVAGVVLSSLAIVGAVVVNVLAVAVFTSVDDAVRGAEDAAAGRGVAADGSERQAGQDAAVLGLGETAEVGDYTVAVTAVNLDGDDVVAGADEFNEPATNQYVVVDLSVVYNGDAEGTPYVDLLTTLDASDARQYDETSCSAVLPRDGIGAPTLTTGGSTEYQVCMDVPPAATEGATVFVEPTFSVDGERAYWAVR